MEGREAIAFETPFPCLVIFWPGPAFTGLGQRTQLGEGSARSRSRVCVNARQAQQAAPAQQQFSCSLLQKKTEKKKTLPSPYLILTINSTRSKYVNTAAEHLSVNRNVKSIRYSDQGLNFTNTPVVY